MSKYTEQTERSINVKPTGEVEVVVIHTVIELSHLYGETVIRHLCNLSTSSRHWLEHWDHG